MKAALQIRLLPLLPWWRWWVGELWAMMPAALRPVPSRPQVRVMPRAASVDVEVSVGKRTERFSDDRPLAAMDDDAWQQLASLCAGADVVLLLPPPRIHTLRIHLPRATLRSLDDAIALQLLREAPLEPGALRWVRHIDRVTRDMVELRVVLAREADLRTYAQAFAAAGVAAPAMGCDGPAGIALFDRGEPGARGPQEKAGRRAAMLALGLILSIPVTSMALLMLRSNAVEQQMAALSEASAERSLALARLNRAAAATRELNWLVRRPSLSAAIEHTAEALPQGAWLAELRAAPETGVEAELVTPDPAALEGMNIIDQQPEGEARVRVTVRVTGRVTGRVTP